ncbi:uncharacterized protein L969DRAFT_52572 [Mixia osmundae IAM 14324]|uniref:Uncharacterized protein n=1 Tax=Mixia osmundae (strain CBS 9802 / IAM 14324 / JCM 22182 / KY 12970) TaxID=764103 RepID=G7E536_MIXOS|nr:uncharacterized protein L969DRAFT_52572 [Mixia osmundae IAM 14324]KEI37808.1 hypothetical protein L969DRAFT_52572 [Mixia osmundae IAM 14324]GAA97946.1 hypothetical protein E5Q_04626 [Mixia osmundae IAM 14324]
MRPLQRCLLGRRAYTSGCQSSRQRLERLVSFYHESSTFANDKDLSSKVDDAFLTTAYQKPEALVDLLSSDTANRQFQSESHEGRRRTAQLRSNRPITELLDGLDVESIKGTSALESDRLRKIFDALHGTSDGGKAGIDVVQERAAELRADGDALDAPTRKD